MQRWARGLVPALLSVPLALLGWSDRSHAREPVVPQAQFDELSTIAIGGLLPWLNAQVADTERDALSAGDLDIESHYCGCFDKPKPHFPYAVVLLKTPRGDLVARPDSREGAVSFAPLAVRYGDRYCKLGSEDDCYGSFPAPCDFTDFRYGPYLEQFFPQCMSQEAGPASPPSGAGASKP